MGTKAMLPICKLRFKVLTGLMCSLKKRELLLNIKLKLLMKYLDLERIIRFSREESKILSKIIKTLRISYEKLEVISNS